MPGILILESNVRSFVMTSIRIAVLIAVLFWLSACASGLLPATPESVGAPSEKSNDAKFNDATALLNQYVHDNKIAGAVAAVAKNGKLIYFANIGVQDLATQIPMSERSLFRIYSMTRAVTSVAVMMLYEEGKFRLDDPVSKYIPEFANVKVALQDGTTRPPTRDIIVSDLLLHTSGLSPRNSALYQRENVRARDMTMDTFIANLVRVPLMEDPGTRYRYSEGSSVLGRLVEVWSGQPFEVFLEERIFKPLKMHDTMFWAQTADQRARLTTVYATESNGLSAIELETIPFNQKPTLIEGAIGLLSSVPDYLRFSQMLLNRGELNGVRLLRASTVDTMTKNGLSEAVQQTRGGTMGWGLGNVNVLLRSSTSPPNIGEYGWDGTAGTIFWIDPTKQTVIILMTQSSPANPDRLREKFKAAVHEALQ